MPNKIPNGILLKIFLRHAGLGLLVGLSTSPSALAGERILVRSQIGEIEAIPKETAEMSNEQIDQFLDFRPNSGALARCVAP
jgi:hypothetical protein